MLLHPPLQSAGRVALLAKTLLLRHHTETGERGKGEGLRLELQAVAANRKAPGYSRSAAAETLFAVEWPGRDEWFLKLFADPTIRALTDGYCLRTPLAQRVGADPSAGSRGWRDWSAPPIAPLTTTPSSVSSSLRLRSAARCPVNDFQPPSA